MTDRKTLGIFLGFFVLMLALALWRINLLDDWTQLPRYGRDGHTISPIHSLILLAQPAGLLFVYAVQALSIAFGKGPPENFRPYRARNAFMIAGVGLTVLSAQILIIARSFGGAALIVDPALFMRLFLIFVGLITIVASNRLPKFPLLRSRIRLLDLDADTRARKLRLVGYHGVAVGMVLIAVALLMPQKLIGKTVLIVSILSVLVTFSIIIWAQVKRRQWLQQQPHASGE